MRAVRAGSSSRVPNDVVEPGAGQAPPCAARPRGMAWLPVRIAATPDVYANATPPRARLGQDRNRSGTGRMVVNLMIADERLRAAETGAALGAGSSGLPIVVDTPPVAERWRWFPESTTAPSDEPSETP
jgi:hypothetical protein